MFFRNHLNGKKSFFLFPYFGKEQQFYWVATYRNNHQRCFAEKGVLQNLANFTGKHLSWSIKKKHQHRRFSVKFAKFFKNTYFEVHLRTTDRAHRITYGLTAQKKEVFL